MLQRLLIKIYGPDWKSSINGDLAFIATICTLITTYVVVTPSTPKWVAAIPAGAGTIAAICRAIVGRQQIDSGKVVVHSEEGPISVSSHEVPDVKGAKPVIPQPKNTDIKDTKDTKGA